MNDLAKTPCSAPDDRPAASPAFFDPEPVRKGEPRVSRMGKRRAWVLLGIHVLIGLHLLHWKIAGETLSPLEPSEAMYTVAEGAVNAGVVLLILSCLSVFVVGRWFCGWACHLVAVQDGCAWLLKKMGIRPRPLRSRALAFVPLGAGLFMFGFPAYVRWAHDHGWPDFGLALTKTSFWETFPGPLLSILTFVVCGGVMVYLLGAKGFCFYACPYGGLFGVADRFAPARIRVTDACKGCGHCSAVCTSNVRVADEVARFRMVVDAGCMKCLDCISTCPEEALYFGFGKPALGARPRSKRRFAWSYSWAEEASLVVVFIGALGIFAGFPEQYFPWATKLYSSVPLLLALGLASTTAFVAIHLARALFRKETTFVGHPLRDGGRLNSAGRVVVILGALWLAFVAQSGVVQGYTWIGYRQFLGDRITSISIGVGRWARLDAETKAAVESADGALNGASTIGLFPDAILLSRLGTLAAIQDRLSEAGDLYERAVATAPDFARAWADLAVIRMGQGRFLEAADAARACHRLTAEAGTWRAFTAQILHRVAEWHAVSQQFDEAIAVLEELKTLDPENPQIDPLIRQLRENR